MVRVVEDEKRRRLIAAHQRWVERAVALREAHRGVTRLSRLLAKDPGGRIAERAMDLERRVALAEAAARAMVAVAESNLQDPASLAGRE